MRQNPLKKIVELQKQGKNVGIFACKLFERLAVIRLCIIKKYLHRMRLRQFSLNSICRAGMNIRVK